MTSRRVRWRRQHVNKADLAVRIAHLPAGTVVVCQNERSQHKNCAMAMKILRARLCELRLQKQRERTQEFAKTTKEIAWGSAACASLIAHQWSLGWG